MVFGLIKRGISLHRLKIPDCTSSSPSSRLQVVVVLPCSENEWRSAGLEHCLKECARQALVRVLTVTSSAVLASPNCARRIKDLTSRCCGLRSKGREPCQIRAVVVLQNATRRLTVERLIQQASDRQVRAIWMRDLLVVGERDEIVVIGYGESCHDSLATMMDEVCIQAHPSRYPANRN